MFVKIKIMTLIALLMLASPPTAKAQPASQEQADKLRQTFQSLLHTKQDQMTRQTQNAYNLKLEGTVSVEPVDDYYAITLPPVTIAYPDGHYLKIGMTAMNASPDKSAHNLKMTMAMPTPMLAFNKAGNEIFRINLGEQKSSGIWDKRLHSFTKLDALFKNIEIDFFEQEPLTLQIPEIRVVYDLEEDEHSRWSGPVHIRANTVSALTQDGQNPFHLGSINIHTRLDKVARQALTAKKPEPEPNLETFYQPADGLETSIKLSNLKIADPDQEGSLKLEEAQIHFGYDNALSHKSDAKLTLSFKNLSLPESYQELQPLIPEFAQFKLSNYNIQVKSLSNLITQAPQDDINMMEMLMLFKIPSILAQAGSYLEIGDTFIQNENYRADLHAIIHADIEAVNSATMEGRLIITGLEKILSMTQVAGTRIHSSNNAETMRTLARFLERLKPLARVKAVSKKGFQHIFDLKVNKKGQVLINDQNALTILQEPAEATPAEN